MTEDRIAALVAAALETLGVAGVVFVSSVELRDSTDWKVALSLPGGAAAIVVADGDDEAGAGAAIREELRRALRLCPLCGRMGHVEKIRDPSGHQDACAVRCPACGDYEIEQALIREFRAAWERGDQAVLARLPGVADRLRQRAPGRPRLRVEDWEA